MQVILARASGGGLGLMHLKCGDEYLDDDYVGWFYVGTAQINLSKLPTKERKCDWCGHSLKRKVIL